VRVWFSGRAPNIALELTWLSKGLQKLDWACQQVGGGEGEIACTATQLSSNVRRLRSPPKSRGGSPPNGAAESALSSSALCLCTITAPTVNNRKRRLPGRKTRFAAEPADEPDLAVSESADGCGEREAQTFRHSSARPAKRVIRRAVGRLCYSKDKISLKPIGK